MRVTFEHPAKHDLGMVEQSLPTPPQEGQWVSLGTDEDEQYVVKTVIWHVHADEGDDLAPWAQVILRDASHR